jgi:single-strand DNA-binding protein
MLNKVILMGRLVDTPELRATTNGTSVATFAIACERDFKDQNNEKKTDFLDCVAWRQTAEHISKWFGKGSMICVEGRIEKRYYEKDGQKRYITEIVVDKAYFTGEKKKDDVISEKPPVNIDGFTPIDEDDDYPF